MLEKHPSWEDTLPGPPKVSTILGSKVLSSSSQPGVILPPRGHVSMPRDIFDRHDWEKGVCHQHLVRTGRGCRLTSYNAQNSTP